MDSNQNPETNESNSNTQNPTNANSNANLNKNMKNDESNASSNQSRPLLLLPCLDTFLNPINDTKDSSKSNKRPTPDDNQPNQFEPAQKKLKIDETTSIAKKNPTNTPNKTVINLISPVDDRNNQNNAQKGTKIH